jgi:hypothetical protein
MFLDRPGCDARPAVSVNEGSVIALEGQGRATWKSLRSFEHIPQPPTWSKRAKSAELRRLNQSSKTGQVSRRFTGQSWSKPGSGLVIGRRDCDGYLSRLPANCQLPTSPPSPNVFQLDGHLDHPRTEILAIA